MFGFWQGKVPQCLKYNTLARNLPINFNILKLFREDFYIKIKNIYYTFYKQMLFKIVDDGLTKTEFCGNLVENLLNY